MPYCASEAMRRLRAGVRAPSRLRSRERESSRRLESSASGQWRRNDSSTGAIATFTACTSAIRAPMRRSIELLRDALDGEPGELAQAFAAGLQVRHDRLAHARLPEALDVVLDAGDGCGAIRLGAEEGLDVVGHLHEASGMRFHEYTTW